MNTCPTCGRRLPCDPCAARARAALEDALLDRLDEMAKEGQPLILWFRVEAAAARQHLNRLMAEWPGAVEVIEPIEEGDMLGCRLALNVDDVGKNPLAEWEVTETRVQPRDDESFLRAIESVIWLERGE